VWLAPVELQVPTQIAKASMQKSHLHGNLHRSLQLPATASRRGSVHRNASKRQRSFDGDGRQSRDLSNVLHHSKMLATHDVSQEAGVCERVDRMIA
jgi:hypothetical protein